MAKNSTISLSSLPISSSPRAILYPKYYKTPHDDHAHPAGSRDYEAHLYSPRQCTQWPFASVRSADEVLSGCGYSQSFSGMAQKQIAEIFSFLRKPLSFTSTTFAQRLVYERA
jgi:hypothetical protein